MSKSQNTFNKNQKEKKKLQKKKEKQQRKEERKANAGDSSLESMMAYLDENGNIVSTPPEEQPKKEEIDASQIEIGVPKRESERDMTRRGVVSFYDASKGYGFIIQNGSEERYFVHANNVSSPIHEGNQVSFKAQRGAKGMDAVEVVVLK